MNHIEILYQGRLKEPFWLEARAEYLKRLSSMAKVTLTELPEGHPVVDRLPRGAYITALCVEGRQVTSEEFAEKLARLSGEGQSSFCFLIGGSEGLPEEAKRRAHEKLSLSRMTFPHHVAQVLLLEQIYRALMISSGRTYHK